MSNKKRGRQFIKMDNIEYLTVMGAEVTGQNAIKEVNTYKPPCPYAVASTNYPGMERIIDNGKTRY